MIKSTFKLPPRPRIKKLPHILSVEEVKRLFESAVNLKHRVLLKTIYSAGLRTGEAVRLDPRHIESDPSRMMIRVEQAKGKKTDILSYRSICLMSSGFICRNKSLLNGFSQVMMDDT